MVDIVFGVDSPTTSSSGALTNTCAHNKAAGYTNSTLPVVHLVVDGEILTLVEAIGRATTSGVDGTGYFGLYVTDITGTVDGALVTSLIPITTSSPTVTWYSSAALSFDLSPWAGQFIKLAVGPDSGWRRGQVTGIAGDTAVIGTSFPDPFGTGTTQSTFYPIKATVSLPDLYSITSVNGDDEINPDEVNTAEVVGYVAGVNPVVSGTVGSLVLAAVSQSLTTVSFTPPAPVNAAYWPEPDTTQTLTLTDGDNQSTFNALFNSLAGYNSVLLVSPDNVDQHKIPYYLTTLAVDDDRLMSTMTLAADGSITDGPLNGTVTVYHWVALTSLIYEYEFYLSDGVITATNSITATGITMAGITMTGLTAVGL